MLSAVRLVRLCSNCTQHRTGFCVLRPPYQQSRLSFACPVVIAPAMVRRSQVSQISLIPHSPRLSYQKSSFEKKKIECAFGWPQISNCSFTTGMKRTPRDVYHRKEHGRSSTRHCAAPFYFYSSASRRWKSSVDFGVQCTVQHDPTPAASNREPPSSRTTHTQPLCILLT